MALLPECRIVMEGTGVVVATLPPFTSWPPVNSEFHLEQNGGGEVVYKVEGYETHAHIVTQTVHEGSPDKAGVECYTNMVVSEV